MAQTVAYGEWPSPITAEAVVAAAASLSDVRVEGEVTVWSESRPSEGGRIQLCRRDADGAVADLLPDGWSARTRVHEYGGGAWTVAADHVYFCSWDDQRIHRIPLEGGAPEPITPEPEQPHGLRYADLEVHGDLLVCVREHHPEGGGPIDVVNELVALPTDGRREPVVLVSGPDFVAAPRVSPDGSTLAWIQWDHPAMPWDATELRTAPLHRTDDAVSLGASRLVAGGAGESVIQPSWSPDGRLHFVSDRTDWWNIYACRDDAIVAVTTLKAEVGTPPWVFGMSRYTFLDDGRVVFAFVDEGVDRLAVVETDGSLTELDQPFTELASIVARGDRVLLVGAAFDREAVVAELTVPRSGGVEVDVLRPARDLGLDRAWFSTARPITFATGPDGQRRAHALYYPPTNPDVVAPAGTAPPLLVLIHGGPTGMARARLDLAKQYWTSRGFALVDVNYGGSTGYGREYRNLLQGAWGIVDVEDCLAAARHLGEQRVVDPDRMCIRGGSAGGFTVLAALASSDVFAAGASSYGVADLSALAEETHKFESRYLDGLVGPYPEAKAVYEERSPISHVDDLDRPLIVFQGLEDEIVPPNQSEVIVDAVRRKGVPVAYLAFEGEQHGFRRAETVIRVLEAELAFYGRVLGFEPAGAPEPPRIDNLD